MRYKYSSNKLLRNYRLTHARSSSISWTRGWIIGPREDSPLRVHIFTQARARAQRSGFISYGWSASVLGARGERRPRSRAQGCRELTRRSWWWSPSRARRLCVTAAAMTQRMWSTLRKKGSAQHHSFLFPPFPGLLRICLKFTPDDTYWYWPI